MEIVRRLKMIRTLEKIKENIGYSQKIGIKDSSKFFPVNKAASKK